MIYEPYPELQNRSHSEASLILYLFCYFIQSWIFYSQPILGIAEILFRGKCTFFFSYFIQLFRILYPQLTSRQLIGPRRQLEWSYELGSVRPPVLPFIRLSGHFLGIVSLVFSKFWHGARNPYEVVCDSLTFRRKDFGSSIGKMDQKWAKNKVFWIC